MSSISTEGMILISRSLLFLLSAALVLPSRDTSASDWWIVGATGASPKREVYLVDAQVASSAADRGDGGRLVTTTAAQVIEPLYAPSHVVYQLKINCGERLMRTESATLFQRDGTTKDAPGQVTGAWVPVPATWFRGVYDFVCSQKHDETDAAQLVHLGPGDLDLVMKSIRGSFWKGGADPAAVMVPALGSSTKAPTGRPGLSSELDLRSAVALAGRYKKVDFSMVDSRPVLPTGPESEIGSEWFLIYAAGEAPHRKLYFAREYRVPLPISAYSSIVNDENYLANRDRMEAGYRGAEITEVGESTDGPDKVVSRIGFQCSSDILQVVSRITWWRDGHADTEGPRALEKAQSPWETRARRFACDRSARAQPGYMASVGKVTDKFIETTELPDLSWSLFWPDDKRRPAYTSSKTPEQFAEEKRQLLQMVAGQQAWAADMANTLRGAAGQMKADNDAEPARQAKIRRDLIRRGKTPAPALERWIGAMESDLVRAWGQPAQMASEEQASFLLYVRGYERQSAIVLSGGGVSGTVGTQIEAHECSVRFEIRDGVVYDYRVAGDRHQCAVESFPTGPRPMND